MRLKACLILVFAQVLLVHPATVKPPNIVLIVADDLGWNDVSFHGSTQIPTPNMDTLAYDGVILNNYYVQPICTPTRAALLTGRFPIHTGLQHGVIRTSHPYGLGLHERLLPELLKERGYSNHAVGKHEVLQGAEPYGLGLKEKLLPQYLRELGYTNHMVGKWHLGFFAKEYTPTYRGFESHYGYYQGMEDYYRHNYWADYRNPLTDGFDFRDGMELDKSAIGKYSTELFTERAENIIRQHNTSKPLFLYLAHQAVHSADHSDPLQAPERYVKRFKHIKNKKRKIYAGMVSALDESVGNVTKALAAAGMLNNTVIVFTTDNGGPVNGFNLNAASNWPLRGCKHTLWEGGTRAVGFVWSPLLKKNRYVSNHLMHVVDWFPTLLRVANYTMSKLDRSLDGMDLWNTLSTDDKHSLRTEFLYNIDDKEKIAGLRIRNMKLILGQSNNGQTNGWYPPWQLPDSKTTISKSNNLDTVTEFVPQNKNVLKINEARSYDIEFKGEAAPDPLFKSDLPDVLRHRLDREVKRGEPVKVHCGERPANASTNCQPTKSPCLYDLEKDPCEFNNLAIQMPDALKEMLVRLREYNATAVPLRNKPEDPLGLPIFHHGAWVPWINLTATDIA